MFLIHIKHTNTIAHFLRTYSVNSVIARSYYNIKMTKEFRMYLICLLVILNYR